jgi:hypothetical protein
MIELLQWVQANDQKMVTSQSLSNLLLLLYCFTYIKSRKGFYIGAFLFIEFMGSSFLLATYSNIIFYLVYAAAYATCYWYEVKIGEDIKIVLAYGIMVLFQSMMVMDAYFYPDVITSIYKAYEFVIVGIHLYIITVIIKPRKLIKSLVDSFNSLSDFLGVGYNLSFCYTVYIIRNQT